MLVPACATQGLSPPSDDGDRASRTEDGEAGEGGSQVSGDSIRHSAAAVATVALGLSLAGKLLPISERGVSEGRDFP
jgi:hypothetical protein